MLFSQASPYEFVQRWNAIPRTAQSIEYARLLEQITPETLPEVITNKLDGMMLTNIIRAIDKQFVPKSELAWRFSSHWSHSYTIKLYSVMLIFYELLPSSPQGSISWV